MATDSKLDEVQTYRQNGFVVLRNFFPSELVESMDREATAFLNDPSLIHQDNLRCRFMPHFHTQELLFECLDPIVDLSASMKTASCWPRLVDILACIYGEQPLLFKDKLIYKPPGAQGYPIHQDYIAWDSFPRSFLSVIIPLDSTNALNGCTAVYKGYHQQGPLTPQDGNFHVIDRQALDESRRELLELEPGDIAIMDGLTPHDSCANSSSGWRRQLFLSFNKASDGGDQRDSHYSQFHQFLRAQNSKQWFFR